MKKTIALFITCVVALAAFVVLVSLTSSAFADHRSKGKPCWFIREDPPVAAASEVEQLIHPTREDGSTHTGATTVFVYSPGLGRARTGGGAMRVRPCDHGVLMYNIWFERGVGCLPLGKGNTVSVIVHGQWAYGLSAFIANDTKKVSLSFSRSWGLRFPLVQKGSSKEDRCMPALS